MKIVNEECRKGACLCRKCNNIFLSKEIEHTFNERSGQLVYEAICPYCGNTNFGLIDYPISEEELIHKNNKFYGLSNKRVQYIEKYNELDEVIDELYM